MQAYIDHREFFILENGVGDTPAVEILGRKSRKNVRHVRYLRCVCRSNREERHANKKYCHQKSFFHRKPSLTVIKIRPFWMSY
jgi:hypothetical protein